MDSNTGQTFIEEMQPNFDALPERLKDEKFRNHLTNQELSDVSGVPIATTSRILSGAVSKTPAFSISPRCAPLWTCQWIPLQVFTKAEIRRK